MIWEVYLKALLENMKKELDYVYSKVKDPDSYYDTNELACKLINLSEEFNGRIKNGDF
jgi:hypothetical protein